MKVFFGIITYILLSFVVLPCAHAADLDFGAIEYVPGAGNLNAILDPADGSLSCNRPNQYTCQSFGTPGSTLITGTPGDVVSIACRNTPDIANGIRTLKIAQANIHIDNTTHDCKGLNNSVTNHTISGVQVQDTVYWGGKLKVTGGTDNLSGYFSSTQGPGGQSQRIRIIFQ
ncbi:MAG: hypothetical protein COV36_01550 [Alphaproteobacteria bacterium CG11_big_fil_rev_8_21_14_0_20_44_7]|nr:MAG: hypothetical protein COV36_01550 [Alphaproteobacteria bacterium CG11_big_fil_rev_8_21_14_0_20_44_7]